MQRWERRYMPVKIFGSILIVLSSTYVGFVLSASVGKRVEELKNIQYMLLEMKNSINFFNSCIPEIFEGLNNDIFKNTLNHLNKKEGKTINECFKKSISEYTGYLNKEDKNILLSFGTIIGTGDLQSQNNVIQMTIDKLKNQQKKAEEEKKKSEKMYRSLGSLAGIAVVLLIF